MAVIITNETRKRLHRQSWARRYQEEIEQRMFKRMNTYIPNEPAGYCVKERKKVTIKNPESMIMKNGRPGIKGFCPDCGANIFKMGKL